MNSNNHPVSDLPNLPLDYTELVATANPGNETRLETYIDQLPGLDRDRFDRLSRIACQAKGGGYRTGLEATVLKLTDLLRTQAHSHVTLHPRVAHVFPPNDLDPFLEGVADILDEGRCSRTAFQYPDRLLECRGEAPNVEALYPPAYLIQIADIVRGLRANGLLTSIRCPDQPLPSREDLRATVDDMREAGEVVPASIILHQPEDELEPNLYIDECSNHSRSPSRNELEDLCVTLCHRHGVLLDVFDFEKSLGES